MTPFEVFWDSLDQPLRFGNQVLAFSWATIFLEFLVPLILLFLVSFFLFRWVKGFVAKTTISDERKVRITRGIRIGLQVLFVVVLLVLSSRFLEDRIVRFIEDVIKAIRSPFYKSGATEISILTLILAIPIFYLATLAGKAAKMAFERSKVFTHNLAEARRFSIANLIRYTVLAVSLIIGLSVIGIDLSAIAVILGVLGVGIGFGLQQVVAAFFSGLVIILNRPFKESDYIRVHTNGNNYEGIIKSIRMLNSTLVTAQNETVIVPNSHLLNNSMQNLSAPDTHYIISIDLSIPYDEDVEKVQELLAEVGRRCPYWNGLGEPASHITAFAGIGIGIQLQLQLSTAVDRSIALAWLHQEIWREFRAKRLHFASTSQK